MCRRGQRPSWIACLVIENAPEMIAWLAMMVATVASATMGICKRSGHSAKKGFPPFSTEPVTTSAVWPA
jgi:hypothetical protein